MPEASKGIAEST